MAPTSATKIIGKQNTAVHYQDRKAVRLLISNEKDQIIIIHVKKGNYYKLPGGGVEANEDHKLAGQREALEETGCKVSVGDMLGTTEEWRNDLHQMSYCYTAKLVKDTGVTQLTELEKGEGLTHQWLYIGKALELMKACKPTSELGQCIKQRDIFFVEKYQEKCYI